MKLYRGGLYGLHVGDITKLAIDAIVNPTNPALAGGVGVDGAVHAAAGPELRHATEALGGARYGEARLTPGFQLPARHIIHVVGPIWKGGQDGEEALLEKTYRSALETARQAGIRALAVPAISTGTYLFPIDLATAVAITTVRAFCDEHPQAFDRVVFCCFSDEHARVYQAVCDTFLR